MKQLFRITSCCLLAACAAFAVGCDNDDPNDNPPGGGTDPISVAAKYALGARTENATAENYRIVLSAFELKGTAEAPKLASAGQFLTIVLHADEQEPNKLPEGTYALVDQPAAGQGDLSACRLETTDAQGNAGAASQVLLNGSVRVSHTAAGYKIDVTGQLSDQRALSYSYEGAIDFSKQPDDPIGGQYDIDLKAQFALGMLASEVADDGSSDFFLTVSDVEMDGDAEEPLFGEAGQYFTLDFVAIEEEPGMLPEGEYVFTAEYPINGVGMLDFSGYNSTDEDGEPLSMELLPLASCTATVTYTDDGYKIVATGELEDGRTFRCDFDGMIEFTDGGGAVELPGLDGNVDATFTIGKATYYGSTEAGTAQYTVDLFDNDFDVNRQNTYRLTLNLFTEMSEQPLQIAPGEYHVGKMLEAGTFYPGWLDISRLQVLGTYCEHTVVNGAEFSLHYGMIEGGTVNISFDNGNYTITADLIDSNNNMIQGTYTGAIEVKNESSYTTLTGDKQVNLNNTVCELAYFGDDYKIGGDNWTIFIYIPQQVVDGIIPADGSEALQIELLSPQVGFEAGLPEGDYQVAKRNTFTPGDRICLPGQYSQGDLYESWYLAGFDNNIAHEYAPFTSGKLNVARSGETYTLTVDVYDDADPQHRITATWSGTPYLFDQTAPPAPFRASKSRAAVKNIPEVGKQPVARSIELRKSAPRHIRR